MQQRAQLKSASASMPAEAADWPQTEWSTATAIIAQGAAASTADFDCRTLVPQVQHPRHAATEHSPPATSRKNDTKKSLVAGGLCSVMAVPTEGAEGASAASLHVVATCVVQRRDGSTQEAPPPTGEARHDSVPEPFPEPAHHQHPKNPHVSQRACEAQLSKLALTFWGGTHKASESPADASGMYASDSSSAQKTSIPVIQRWQPFVHHRRGFSRVGMVEQSQVSL